MTFKTKINRNLNRKEIESFKRQDSVLGSEPILTYLFRQ